MVTTQTLKGELTEKRKLNGLICMNYHGRPEDRDVKKNGMCLFAHTAITTFSINCEFSPMGQW